MLWVAADATPGGLLVVNAVLRKHQQASGSNAVTDKKWSLEARGRGFTSLIFPSSALAPLSRGPSTPLSVATLVELDIENNALEVLCATAAVSSSLRSLKRLRGAGNRFLSPGSLAPLLLSPPSSESATAAAAQLPPTSSASAMRDIESPELNCGLLHWLSALPASLTVLDLSRNSSSAFQQGTRGAVTSAPAEPTAGHLDLWMFRSWRSFLAEPGPCQLRELNLSGNAGPALSSEYVLKQLLRHALGGGSLELLDLSGCGLTDSSLEIAFGMSGSGLAFTIEGDTQLRSLSSLNLSKNRLTRLPVKLITTARYLREVDISENPISNEWALQFARETGGGTRAQLSITMDAIAAAETLRELFSIRSTGNVEPAADRSDDGSQDWLGGTMSFGSFGGDLGGDADGDMLGDLAPMEHSVDLDDEFARMRVADSSFFSPQPRHLVAPNHQAVTPGTYFAARSAALGRLDGQYAQSAEKPSWNQNANVVSEEIDKGYIAPPIEGLTTELSSASESGGQRRRKRNGHTPAHFAALSRMRERRLRQELQTPDRWVKDDAERFANLGEALADQDWSGSGFPSPVAGEQRPSRRGTPFSLGSIGTPLSNRSLLQSLETPQTTPGLRRHDDSLLNS